MTENNPLITVVTVVFNDEQNIASTIESVLNQNYPNLEYIIVDGNSNDNTLSIINNYKNQITKIISEPDKGIYDAMNKAISAASPKSSYINFMNSGDTYYDHKTLHKLKAYFGKGDLIYGNTYLILKKKEMKWCPIKPPEIWKRMPFSHQSLFARTELLKKNKFNIKYKIAADYDFIYGSYINSHNFVDTGLDIAVCSQPGVSNDFVTRTKERLKIVNSYKFNINYNLFYLKLFFDYYRKKFIA